MTPGSLHLSFRVATLTMVDKITEAESHPSSREVQLSRFKEEIYGPS